MLLAPKRKFVFIHVPKVAGQSVTNALMPYAAMPWQRILSTVLPYRVQLKLFTKLRRFTGMYFLPQPFDDHVKAVDIVDSIGADAFESLYSFAFVRNPWAWTLSRYTYALKNPRHNRHQITKDAGSFEGYVQWLCTARDLFYLQKDFVCNADGDCIVKFIGKQEQLDVDFSHVCDALGIQAKLPTFNVSRDSSYRDSYNEETRQLITELYAEDIEFFQYEF